jgi:hypothetical protein
MKSKLPIDPTIDNTMNFYWVIASFNVEIDAQTFCVVELCNGTTFVEVYSDSLNFPLNVIITDLKLGPKHPKYQIIQLTSCSVVTQFDVTALDEISVFANPRQVYTQLWKYAKWNFAKGNNTKSPKAIVSRPWLETESIWYFLFNFYTVETVNYVQKR